MLIFFLALAAGGCAPMQKNSKVRTYSKNVEDIGGLTFNSPKTMADLKVAPKRFKIVLDGSDTLSLSGIRQRALSQATYKYKADVIIEPIFYVEQWKGGYKVKLTGYVGKYVNLRTASSEDLTVLELTKGGGK